MLQLMFESEFVQLKIQSQLKKYIHEARVEEIEHLNFVSCALILLKGKNLHKMAAVILLVLGLIVEDSDLYLLKNRNAKNCLDQSQRITRSKLYRTTLSHSLNTLEYL